LAIKHDEPCDNGNKNEGIHQSKTFRVAFVTNFRPRVDPEEKKWISRGNLVTDWFNIESEEEEQKYIDTIFQNIDSYRGFNLVFGKIGPTSDKSWLKYISNYHKGNRSSLKQYRNS